MKHSEKRVYFQSQTSKIKPHNLSISPVFFVKRFTPICCACFEKPRINLIEQIIESKI